MIRCKISFASLLAITISIPECTHISAASSLVYIPPVPRAEPAPPATLKSSLVKWGTSCIKCASANSWGSLSYSPSISERRMSRSASATLATIAERVSLSPIFISSTVTASFSLMIGITPNSSNAESAPFICIYRLVFSASPFVIRSCATVLP